MKLQTSKKAVKDYFTYIISAGYCSLQCLLAEQQAFSYCAGVYGWNCDNYQFRGVCISTGYRPIGDQNTMSDYEIIKKYEALAREIDKDRLHFEQRKEEKEKLIYAMIDELIIVDQP